MVSPPLLLHNGDTADVDGISLIRSGTERPYPWQLLQHPFILTSESKKVNMGKWVATLCGW